VVSSIAGEGIVNRVEKWEGNPVSCVCLGALLSVEIVYLIDC